MPAEVNPSTRQPVNPPGPVNLHVARWLTILALLAVTAGIISLTVVTSGKSYSKVDPFPLDDVRHVLHRVARKPMQTDILALIIVPIIGNIVLFLPWGFLMFISLYTANRPTVQTYILTILLGFTLSVCIEGWQYFLPTRVASVNDVIWNTTGTILGAILGHMRLRIRFEFE